MLCQVICRSKKTMNQHKSPTVFDTFNSVPLPLLDGLPPAPPISKSFAAENLFQ